MKKKYIKICISTPSEGSIKLKVPTENSDFLTWKEIARLFFDALSGLGYYISDDVVSSVCEESK